MRYRTRFAAASVVLAVVMAGCQQITPSQALPAPVASNFHEDYPGARITSVEIQPQSDGTSRYRIKFLDRFDFAQGAVFDQQGNWISGDRSSWFHPRP